MFRIIQKVKIKATFLHKKEAVGQTKLKVQKTNTASARKPRAAVLK